jgi:hypothetical protein
LSVVKNRLSIGVLSFLLLVVMGTFEIYPIANGQSEIGIPGWIKNSAGWWAEGAIDDDTFVQGIQFLIKEGIMSVPPKIPPVADSDGDGIPDDVDDCPNVPETVNGFEDSDGCPDVVPVSDNSLTIVNSNFEVNRTGGWSDTMITLEWTYFVEHVDNDGKGFPELGHFVMDISGFASGVGNAEHVQGNEFSGSITFDDDACSDGEFVIEIQSFIGDDRGNYQGDGDIIEKSIPSCRDRD